MLASYSDCKSYRATIELISPVYEKVASANYIFESSQYSCGGEETGNVSIKGGKLKGIEIGGDIVPNIIDEIPIIAVAAALADGKTIIKDAGELRVKESDRISAVAENLRKMGAVTWA